MKIIYYLLLILFINNNVFSKSLFDTDFHEVNFFSNDIESDKIKNISDLKFLSFHNLLNNIMIKKDFLNIKNNLDEDLINTFIQNIIIEDEKIINNNYYSKIKINFNKKILIKYFRKNQISYVEYLPNQILIIIYENNYLEKNFFSLNNLHYKYLSENFKDHKFYRIPNLDINDKYLLSFEDIKNKNLKKINKFKKKYSNLDSAIIIVNDDKKIINYFSYIYLKDQIIDIDKVTYNEYNYNDFFIKFKELFLNNWKIENQIQNKYINKINCKISYYNLNELKKIKEYIEKVSIIKNIELKNISFKLNNYDIHYYGNKDILFKLFKINKLNLKFNNSDCKILLI